MTETEDVGHSASTKGSYSRRWVCQAAHPQHAHFARSHALRINMMFILLASVIAVVVAVTASPAQLSTERGSLVSSKVARAECDLTSKFQTL